jgi:uncharacterized protein (TIGR03067 family)
MRNHALTLLGVVLLLGAQNPPKGGPKTDLDRFQGTWTVASAEREGKTDPTRQGATITFSGKNYKRTSPAQTAKGTFKLTPEAKPPAIDVTFTEGPDKGKSLQGIYAFESDGIRMCFAASLKNRPTDFSSKAGSGQLLVRLVRAKAVAAKPAPPPAPSPFADKNLEEAVRAVLQEPKAELNDSNLVNVHILEAPGKKIKSLKGLEQCKNLALLKLTGNQIVDLTPLKELSVCQSLDLADNKITDVAPLAGLKHLQYLELSNNQISNVGPLKDLTELSALYLSGNKITDIGPLAALTRLSSLYMSRNQIRDLSPLAKVNRISTLEIQDNLLEDLNPLKKQTELSMLLLDRNKIADLTPLVESMKADAAGEKRMAPFLRLYLAGNPLSSTAKTTQLSALKSYGVRVEN